MINLENIVGIEKRNPATEDEIRAVEKEMNIIFPESYKELLKSTNGFLVDNGLAVYGTEEIVERNSTLEVNEYAKGYLAIGDDSGDTVFILNEDDSNGKVLAVGCGYMNPLDGEIVADSLTKWLCEGCKFDDLDEGIEIEYYGILVIGNPKNGLKDLVKIKNIVDSKMSSAELLKASKNIPFFVISNISQEKALGYLKKLNEFSDILQLKKLNN